MAVPDSTILGSLQMRFIVCIAVEVIVADIIYYTSSLEILIYQLALLSALFVSQRLIIKGMSHACIITLLVIWDIRINPRIGARKEKVDRR